VNEYINSNLKDNKDFKNLSNELILKIKEDNTKDYFNKFTFSITLRNNSEIPNTINDIFSKYFTINYQFNDNKKDNFKFKQFLKHLDIEFTNWYVERETILSCIENKMDLTFNNNDYFSSSNVIEKIKYDINKYFSDKFILDFKQETISNTLKYNENNELDKNIYNNLNQIFKDTSQYFFDHIANLTETININYENKLLFFIENLKTCSFYRYFMKNYLIYSFYENIIFEIKQKIIALIQEN
jgi:hypothetical protein